MRQQDYRTPRIDVGRAPLPSGQPRYGLIVTDREIAITIHRPYDDPSKLIVAATNAANDFKPARLNRHEARALRDAIDLFLSDATPNPEA